MTDILEGLYARNNRRELISPDPLQFVHKYSEPADMEIAGFLAAALAYGRVQQIEKSLTDLFERMGDSPSEFVRNFNRQKRAKLADFKHRFTAGRDISDLLTLLKTILNRHGDIETFFLRGYDPGDLNIIGALSKFCDSLLAMHAKTHRGRVATGLGYLLPRPAAGSPCKRLNLFLRWMVRSDDVDVGLWKSLDKARLIVPVDV
ncbi:MAG: TIGR02757 family protein, partial [Planctomycetota bacterium]